MTPVATATPSTVPTKAPVQRRKAWSWRTVRISSRIHGDAAPSSALSAAR